MPRKKINNYQVFSFDGLDINVLVEKHLELLPTNGKGYIHPSPIPSFIDFFDPITNKIKLIFNFEEQREWEKSEKELISKIKVPYKNKTVLYDKYTFLIHQIIYTYMSLDPKYNGIFSLPSKMLDHVLGDDYRIMIDTLFHLFICQQCRGYYDSQCASYSIIPPFRSKIIKINNTNFKVQSYVEKVTSYFLSNNNKQIKLNYQNFYSDNFSQFFKIYNQNLNKIQCYPSNYVDIYFNQFLFSSEQKKFHHQDIINKLQSSNKIIYNIDHNGRIYHVLTSTKKMFKDLLNIKFAIDTKNSQPLLLCYHFIQHFSIDFNFIQSLLSSVESEESYINYFPQLLYKYNKNRKLRVPKDVAAYLYVTMKGRFWEEFAETFPEYTRTEVKIEMFKDIFFGKRNGHIWSDFAKKFKMKYPRVYSIINNELKKNSYKDLSALLTSTESKIFHSILTKLFAMNVEAVNLHDSIVVLDTPNNENVTESQIIEIMKEVYYSYSIIPSFSTEYYNVSNFEEKVKELIQ